MDAERYVAEIRILAQKITPTRRKRQYHVVSQEGFEFRMYYLGSVRKLNLLLEESPEGKGVELLCYVKNAIFGYAPKNMEAGFATLDTDLKHSVVIINGKFAKYEDLHKTAKFGIYPQNPRIPTFAVFIKVPQEDAYQMRKRKNYLLRGILRPNGLLEYSPELGPITEKPKELYQHS